MGASISISILPDRSAGEVEAWLDHSYTLYVRAKPIAQAALRRISVRCDQGNDKDYYYDQPYETTVSFPNHNHCTSIRVTVYFGDTMCATKVYTGHVCGYGDAQDEDAIAAGCTVDPPGPITHSVCTTTTYDYRIALSAYAPPGWRFIKWELESGAVGQSGYLTTTESPNTVLVMPAGHYIYNERLWVNAYFYPDSGCLSVMFFVGGSGGLRSVPWVGEVTSADVICVYQERTITASASQGVAPWVFGLWYSSNSRAPGITVMDTVKKYGAFDQEFNEETAPSHWKSTATAYYRPAKKDGDSVIVFEAWYALCSCIEVVVDYPGFDIDEIDPSCVLDSLAISVTTPSYATPIIRYGGNSMHRSYWWYGRNSDGRLLSTSTGHEQNLLISGSLLSGVVGEVKEVEIDGVVLPVGNRSFSVSAGGILMYGPFLSTMSGVPRSADEDPYVGEKSGRLHRLIIRMVAGTRNTGQLLYGAAGSLIYGKGGNLLYSGELKDPCTDAS